ncbi:MAG: hypothetical protein SPL00_04635 [Bacilli bacterium]|nr:hypothetical protein [Bacilli bacterium]
MGEVKGSLIVLILTLAIFAAAASAIVVGFNANKTQITTSDNAINSMTIPNN